MSDAKITPQQFNDEFNSLLMRAAEAQLPLGLIVQTFEIAKVSLVVNQIEYQRQANAVEFAKRMAEQATKDKPIITP